MFILPEVVGQRRRATEEQDSTVLLADATRFAPTTLHRHEQHDHAENIAEHGGGSLRLHVMSLTQKTEGGWTTTLDVRR